MQSQANTKQAVSSPVAKKTRDSGLGFRDGYFLILDDPETIQRKLESRFAKLSRRGLYGEDFLTVGQTLRECLSRFKSSIDG
jgi:hypothetical protein